METFVFYGSWHQLEDFVLFKMPPSHDICFLLNANDLQTQTYIFCLDSKIAARLKSEFNLTKLDNPPSFSNNINWIVRGNKNLLPDDLWQILYGR